MPRARCGLHGGAVGIDARQLVNRVDDRHVVNHGGMIADHLAKMALHNQSNRVSAN